MIFIGAALATLLGCVPYVTSYVYLESPGVTYRRAPCYDDAPVGAVYERGGVRFELTLEPLALSHSKDAYLKLSAPRNTAISIPMPIANIKLRGQSEVKSTTVLLKAVPLDWQGPYVDEMRRKSPLAEYRFIFLALPPIQSPGTVKLPAVLIDGVPVESPIFTFERRTYAGMVPLNC